MSVGKCTVDFRTFGESSVLSRMPSRFTVVAAENVEVFAIGPEDFSIIFNRYPLVKGILSIRTGGGRFDYFGKVDEIMMQID